MVIAYSGLQKWGMYRRTGAKPALPEPQNCIKRRACAPTQRCAEPHLLCGGQSGECLADLVQGSEAVKTCSQTVRHSPIPPVPGSRCEESLAEPLLRSLRGRQLGSCGALHAPWRPEARHSECETFVTFRLLVRQPAACGGSSALQRAWALKNHLLESSWRLTELSWRLLESLGGVLGSLTGVLGGAGTLAWFLAARCLFNINFQSTYKPLQHHFQSISNRSAHSAVPGQR